MLKSDDRIDLREASLEMAFRQVEAYIWRAAHKMIELMAFTMRTHT
jgi:hypothetical protein